MEKASPSRSESLSRGGWLTRSKQARVAPSSLERLDAIVDACLGESFNSSTASFIDMDPAEDLFSMRWTSSSDDAALFDFGLLPLTDTDLPCELSGIARYDVVSSEASSPVFHSAQSTPASTVFSGSRHHSPSGANNKPRRTAPLLATRRLLLRYLRFLVPLCRKARTLSARSGSSGGRALAATATPARRSTSSVVPEPWCHGNADTAVRDAILYCKKSFTARAEY